MFGSLSQDASDSDSDTFEQLTDYTTEPARNVSKSKRPTQLIRTLSSNLKDKLQKKQFQRIDDEDRDDQITASPDIQHDADDEDTDLMNGQYEDTQIDDSDDDNDHTLRSRRAHNSDDENSPNSSYADSGGGGGGSGGRGGQRGGSKVSDDDEGGHDQDTGSISPQKGHSHHRLSCCVSMASIFCHLCSMSLVTLCQFAINSALYIIVPLHVRDTLKGGEILTGFMFMNYGMAYLCFSSFGSMACSRYGCIFTMMLSMICNTLCLLLMAVFTEYVVWFAMMFIEGASFAMFSVSLTHFITTTIIMKQQRTVFESSMTVISRIAMVIGCLSAGGLIDIEVESENKKESVDIALISMMILSIFGLIVLCTLTVPPSKSYNKQKGQSKIALVPHSHSNRVRASSKGSFSSWKGSMKQFSIRQRMNLFSWIRMDPTTNCSDSESITFAEDELNTLAVWKRNVSTLSSILIFSFGLTFIRCSRMLVLTFQSMTISSPRLSAAQIGSINALSFVPEIVLCLIGERALYRYGRRCTLIPSFVLLIAAMSALSFCNDFQSLSAMAVVFGIGNGISHGLIHKVAIDVAPTEFRDNFLKIYHSSTHSAYIAAPILVAVWFEGFGMETTGIWIAVIGMVSLLWSWCIMTDPRTSGKRYEQLDFERGDEEPSMLINGKHIGPPIQSSNRYKMEIKSIDSVMEHSESVVVVNGFDENGQNDNDNLNADRERRNAHLLQIFNGDDGDKTDGNKENEVETTEQNKKRGNGNAGGSDRRNQDFGAELNRASHYRQNNFHHFEIGHFEEDDEESMSYQLSSTDEEEQEED